MPRESETRRVARDLHMLADLTRRILESPEHWPWMHDRFRTSPQRH